MENTMESVLAHAEAAIKIPRAAMRVLEMSHDPRTPIEALADVIESDVALGARVLRVANSPIYANRGNFSDINRAVTWMGFREVSRIAIAVGALGEFSKVQTRLMTISQFQIHSLTTATLCEELAKKMAIDTSTAFTAGLLHDIGTLIMFSACEDVMMEVLEAGIFEEDEPLYVKERDRLGFDHAQVGAALARQWGMPESIALAIAHHHDLACPDDELESVALVAYANYLLDMGGAALEEPAIHDPGFLEKIATVLPIDTAADYDLIAVAQHSAQKMMPSN